MTDTFTTWINFVLTQEGGLTDDANDPGGLTSYGIDQRSHPDVDIRNLTRDGAIAIYQADYWLKSRADKLPPALAMIYADAAVNQGLGAAAVLLQQSLGVKADGNIGPVTLAAANTADVRTLVTEFAARRALRYAGTANLASFGLGWMRRLAAAHALALSLAPVAEVVS